MILISCGSEVCKNWNNWQYLAITFEQPKYVHNQEYLHSRALEASRVSLKKGAMKMWITHWQPFLPNHTVLTIHLLEMGMSWHAYNLTSKQVLAKLMVPLFTMIHWVTLGKTHGGLVTAWCWPGQRCRAMEKILRDSTWIAYLSTCGPLKLPNRGTIHGASGIHTYSQPCWVGCARNQTTRVITWMVPVQVLNLRFFSEGYHLEPVLATHLLVVDGDCVRYC